ncbi:MAG: cell division protein ZapE [Rhodospirillales bacterium]|nr:AFG1 family ATPase [Alphaproteobacteria bacterium]MCB9987588.1 cell division protein ZapE [Rhodospirillales bacterium]USO07695.1 MAG: cell division protein ZapE [Rhodospirillales bacterium]
MPALAERYAALVRTGEIQRDPAQERAVAAMDGFRRHFLTVRGRTPGLIDRLRGRKSPATGLYLYGGVGRGKTMLMDLLVASLPPERVRRVHFHAFMLEIHARLKAVREGGAPDDFIPRVAQDIARDTDLLCFDELHVNDIADAMILGPLFVALMDAGVSVVATSNYRPDDLYANGLQRARFLPFIALIKARMGVCHVEGPTDYRHRALSERGTWFHPLNGHSRDAMAALFETLTGHRNPGPSSIEVDGRDLPLLHADARCAWLTFDVLCRENRGASDYLALGAVFEIVFLDAIPEMGEAQRNEARRFMTLIDTLYDTRRVLVARAATAPQSLYTGDSNKFEWDRTVSRLLEMQSPAWFAHKA